MLTPSYTQGRFNAELVLGCFELGVGGCGYGAIIVFIVNLNKNTYNNLIMVNFN